MRVFVLLRSYRPLVFLTPSWRQRSPLTPHVMRCFLQVPVNIHFFKCQKVVMRTPLVLLLNHEFLCCNIPAYVQ